ncbi:dicarboxylate carrier UCP2-like [Arctopsyche grandis]|uniref:dicarboxylate carrier UCP2-like n=1 Tax=Arctopsyche grandis TaxID=121162 RepID=UPI00406D98CF
MAPAPPVDNSPLGIKLLTAGTSGCVADFITFPLDTAKVRLQIQGEGRAVAIALTESGGAAVLGAPAIAPTYKGVGATLAKIVRQEGPKALYNGLSAGLQRQMCFAGVRLGLYDTVKAIYLPFFDSGRRGGGMDISARIAAGITTGAMAVLLAQPTDVVKVRMQAQGGIYKSTIQAYKNIGRSEGVKGLWKGTLPNIGRNGIINVAEIVCYDIVKEMILRRSLMEDAIPCHFISAVIAGFCATVVASPVDVVKTRYMNSPSGKYKGAIDCAMRMGMQEGPTAFYKGFIPSFYRLVSWNICMWITYEQIKKVVSSNINSKKN